MQPDLALQDGGPMYQTLAIIQRYFQTLNYMLFYVDIHIITYINPDIFCFSCEALLGKETKKI